MKGIAIRLTLLILMIFSSCKDKNEEDKFASAKEQAVSTRENEIETPFGRVIITEPDFSGTSRYMITEYGAIEGDKEKISEALNKAIDLAHSNGVGKVIIPEGEWLTS